MKPVVEAGCLTMADDFGWFGDNGRDRQEK
jgi:hypothetical protein